MSSEPCENVAQAQSLSGCRIVVTRPEPQASRTVDALVAAGAEALAIPLIETIGLPVVDVIKPYKEFMKALKTPTKVIFVSAAAVTYGMPVIQRFHLFRQYARYIAIGAATAKLLGEHANIKCVYVPTDGEDSESLLADPILQNISGQIVIIVKGASDRGGRTLLAETLATRGAMVMGFNCYVRQPVKMLPLQRRALRWSVLNATHVIAGSVETLDAFELHDEGLFKRIHHLLVPHQRIAAVAKKRGVKTVSVVSLEDNKLVDDMHKLMS